MNKTAFFDLDGIIADSTARFEQATLPNGKTDWKCALNPAHVKLDVPIEGALETINEAERRGFSIAFLTGRPENMREATLDWMTVWRLYVQRYHLLMRADGDYRPAGLVKADLINAYMQRSAIMQTIILVDDTPENARDVLNYAALDGVRVYLAFSCKECMELLERLQQS